MRDAVARWWRREAIIPAATGWTNLAIGAACGVCALLDIRLGLQSLGRWYLGYFAVVLVGWGALVIRSGRGSAARHLRLAGDVLGWLGLVGFAVAGLLLDPPEYPALITLIAFAVGVVAARAVTPLVRRRR